MQPNRDPVGELTTNGASPDAGAAELPASQLQGGSSPSCTNC